MTRSAFSRSEKHATDIINRGRERDVASGWLFFNVSVALSSCVDRVIFRCQGTWEMEGRRIRTGEHVCEHGSKRSRPLAADVNVINK